MHRLAEVLMRGFRMRNWSNFAWLVFIVSALFSSKIISFLILKLLTGKLNLSHGRGLSKITVCVRKMADQKCGIITCLFSTAKESKFSQTWNENLQNIADCYLSVWIHLNCFCAKKMHLLVPNLCTPKFLEMSTSYFLITCTSGYVQVSFLVLKATQLRKDQGHFTWCSPPLDSNNCFASGHNYTYSY